MSDIEKLKSSLKEEILNELKATTKGLNEPLRDKGPLGLTHCVVLKPKKNKKTDEKTDTGEKPVKPKRKCTEKQLAALAAGRQKNPRWIAKRMKEEEARKKQEEEEKKKQEEETP